MMVDGAEERQLKGPIDVLAPYTWRRESVMRRTVTGPVSLPVDWCIGPNQAADGDVAPFTTRCVANRSGLVEATYKIASRTCRRERTSQLGRRRGLHVSIIAGLAGGSSSTNDESAPPAVAVLRMARAEPTRHP